MRVIVLRTIYTEESTAGVMLVNNTFFGYTLEDRVRPYGRKVYGQTAIPAGVYELLVTHSPRFKRDMCLIPGVSNFVGVRIHSGNTPKDTSGCILVAQYRISPKRIWKSKERALTELIRNSRDSTIEIVDTIDGDDYLYHEGQRL